MRSDRRCMSHACMLSRMPEESSRVTREGVGEPRNGDPASAERSGDPGRSAGPASKSCGDPAHSASPAAGRSGDGIQSAGPAAQPGGDHRRSAGPAPRRGGAPAESDAGRYEALPGLTGLPSWIWRRLPRPVKVGVALLPFVAVGLVLALGPGIEEGKEKRASAQAERLAEARAERVERLRREQRPRFAAGEPAAASLAGRRRLLDRAAAAVFADARARVAAGGLDGPIRRVECERYPRTVDGRGAHEDTSQRFGRYACLAVTSEFAPGEANEGGMIGHPYRMRIDFGTGRYALCKVSGRAGEGSIGTTPLVPVPRACGGT
jgi:hypothetical protein